MASYITYTEKQMQREVVRAVAAALATTSYESIVLGALLEHLCLTDVFNAMPKSGSAAEDAQALITELKCRSI